VSNLFFFYKKRKRKETAFGDNKVVECAVVGAGATILSIGFCVERVVRNITAQSFGTHKNTSVKVRSKSSRNKNLLGLFAAPDEKHQRCTIEKPPLPTGA